MAVPYRVDGKRTDTVLPVFEKSRESFGTVVGDTRTREELHALGVPTKYLDRGVVVQPMYFYMGHISRHVRPGSRAVHAIVDQSEATTESRTFRKTEGLGAVVGGGINNLARDGVELTLWPCEGSTRQQWALNDDGQLQVFGHDWLGRMTSSCVAKEPDYAFGGVTLTKCDETAALFKTVVANDTLKTVNLFVNNGNHTNGEDCLVAKPLKGNGGAYGPRGGAQVTIGNCEGKPVSIIIIQPFLFKCWSHMF